ncbi:hypothetical protein SLEP1_g55832 [Rubroshorea leprosula]|uniref:BHLH domain-containing protein n=1 Tax=Rubroshorea leprosula TaxID=152421 RepID=A0AAV5MJ55_9ROSI|nr:hypothetical protein SLEP1_g55832 [Rubroshorea leprosula]
MADEFNSGTNFWDSSSRNRFDAGSSSSSSGLNMGSFGWPTEIVDMKSRTSMDSGSVSGGSVGFHDTQKLQASGSDPAAAAAAAAAGEFQMMGLGLSSQSMDWNQATLLRGDKPESGFRSMVPETVGVGIGSSSQLHWRTEKMFSGVGSDSAVNEFKQINPRGFSLDQPYGSSSDSTTSFQMDSPALYGSQSTILQGLLVPENQAQQSSFETRSMNYQYGTGYSINPNEFLPSWSKVPPFLRTSPTKQSPHSQLQFSNNAPFWNPLATSISDTRPTFPSLQTQFPSPSFEEKPKNISEVRDTSSTATKKSGSEPASKRTRNETGPSPLPAFKVRKEKMGDRITALQQMVSPFGKTDTASVLSEVIEYIKFLHEQVTVLSTPYMKSGASIQHQQCSDKSKDPEGPKQDLRSRGLCLVPVSSTFPVTHETSADFWTPTFGGTFR